MSLMAQRKLGEMLGNTIIHGTKSHDVTLSDYSITNMQSHRWQNKPEENFPHHSLPAKNSQQHITLAQVGIDRNDSPKFRG